jgi:serine/threonine-protein phosphatase 2A activator
MLNDISAVCTQLSHLIPLTYPHTLVFVQQVKTWDKVNTGMQKMYIVEVLGKLPVMQHFLFGSILVYDGPLPPQTQTQDQNDPHWGHAHARGDLGGAGQQSTGFGDCCGIPIPSAFGAAQAEKGRPLAGIRPVPFD